MNAKNPKPKNTNHRRWQHLEFKAREIGTERWQTVTSVMLITRFTRDGEMLDTGGNGQIDYFTWLILEQRRLRKQQRQTIIIEREDGKIALAELPKD